jgi:hypothetical protein
MTKVRTQLQAVGNRLRSKHGAEVAKDAQGEIDRACEMLAQAQIRKGA